MNKTLISTATITIGIVAVVFSASAAERAKPVRPNVVIIYADDLGYGDLSCYNPEGKISTPNIDALAERGVRFTDAHSASSISGPSRYSIITGQYSWRTDVKRGNPPSGKDLWVSPDRVTIASLLDNEGYNTAAIGKWGLGANYSAAARPGRTGYDFSPEAIDYSKPIPSAQAIGFDYEALHRWFGTGGFRKVYTHTLCDGSEVKYSDGARWYFENSMSRDGDPQFEKFDMEEAQIYYIDKAVEYINVASGRGRNKSFNLDRGKPFFLYYAPHIPHYPHVPSDQFEGKSEVGIYGDFIMQLDWAVGRIVEALEERKQLDNTIIIFASDNGPEKQTYDYIEKYDHRSMGDFRGVKRDLYQGGHTTPLIVSYPQSSNRGRVSDRLISQSDIFATLADLMDIEYDNQECAEDSFSFADEILDGYLVENRREIAIHHSSDGKLALRSGDWVLINATNGSSTLEPEWFRQSIGAENLGLECELFNLRDDPQQTKNLVRDYPDKVSDLRAELKGYVSAGRTVFND
ncbi:MAG: arylsulfatase [Rikenellaceae bacterium]